MLSKDSALLDQGRIFDEPWPALTRRDETLLEFAAELEDKPFRFAKTLPHNPHFYCERTKWEGPEGLNDPESPFSRACAVVQRHGHPEWFKGHKYIQLPVNGYTYWTMGWPAHETTILNRKTRHYDTPYDEIAKGYDDFFSEPRYEQEDTQLVEAIGREGLAGHTVLDIGCGTGLAVRLPLGINNKQHYSGLDTSQRMLWEFIAQFPGLRHRLQVCSFQEFYPTERYDTILMLYGSAVNLSPEQIGKACHLLNPGGSIYAMIRDPKIAPTTWKTFGFTEVEGKGSELVRSLGEPLTRIGYYVLYQISAP